MDFYANDSLGNWTVNGGNNRVRAKPKPRVKIEYEKPGATQSNKKEINIKKSFVKFIHSYFIFVSTGLNETLILK